MISSANDPNKHVPEAGIRHYADHRMQLNVVIHQRCTRSHPCWDRWSDCGRI